MFEDKYYRHYDSDEDREKEKEEEQEKKKKEEKKKEEEREIQRRLRKEEKSLDAIKRVQAEMYHLNDSINACINLAAASVMSLPVNKQYNTMRHENNTSFARTAQSMDDAASQTQRNINQLQDRQDTLAEQKRVEQEQTSPPTIPRL